MSFVLQEVKIDLSNAMSEYLPKVIIFFNHQWLIDKYTPVFIEENKIFCICFDTTPLNELENMKDYAEVVRHFPGSNYVLSKGMWIGNYENKDFESVIKDYLKMWFGKYEIFDKEEGYTLN